MPRYIDADKLIAFAEEHKPTFANSDFFDGYYDLLRMIRDERVTPAADVVEFKFFDIVLKRLKHLLQSKYIASFDKVKIGTGEYIRDIKEADNEQKVKHGEWLEDGAMYKCSNCGNLESYYSDTYCRCCGAKMDGETYD